jgi:hypothetical protein
VSAFLRRFFTGAHAQLPFARLDEAQRTTRAPADERESEDDVRRMSSLPRRALLLALPVAAALSLAACGESGDPAASAADAEAKAETARIRLQQCLRENGLDLPANPGSGGTRIRIDLSKARAAMQKCRKFQEAATESITPEQRQEFRDAFAKFAACMRKQGVDIPEPGTGERPAQGAPPRDAGGRRLGSASPTEQAAMKVCQDELPEGRIGGGGIRIAAPAGAGR